MGAMQTEPGGTVEFDPESPIARFILGIANIFFGGEQDDDRNPQELKAEVERLIVETAPEPKMSLKPPEQLAIEEVEAGWEALDRGEDDAEEHALAALRHWPNCADAYTLLGVSAGGQLELALPLFTLAVMAGAEALGPEGFERFAGQFWKAPATRPFMGALGFLARANRDAGALDAAAAHYVEMLNLNPDDDQGARYDLLALSLQTGRLETAEKILQAYGDDTSATFAYCKALYAFLRSGDSDASRLALRAAREANPHVVEYLLGLRTLPEEIPDSGEPGGEGEAVLMVDLFGPAWIAAKGAVEWLRKQTVLPQKGPPAKEKRSGPREI
jgi:tetratricopeptide (TPR) repeat protein